MKSCPICGSVTLNKYAGSCDIDLKGTTCVSRTLGFEKIYMCKECGFAFAAPTPSPTDLDEFYTWYYHTSRSHHTNMGATPEFVQLQKKASKWRFDTIRAFRNSPGTVLDIGCGCGFLLNEMKSLGWMTFGIEPNMTLAWYGREILGLSITRGSFEQSHSKYDDGSFDVVIVSHVLHMVKDPLHLLSICRSKLKETGLLFVELPNALWSFDIILQNLNRRMKGRAPLYPFGMPLLYYFTPKTLRRILEKSGFIVLRIRTFNPEKFNVATVVGRHDWSKLVSWAIGKKRLLLMCHLLDWLCAFFNMGAFMIAISERAA